MIFGFLKRHNPVLYGVVIDIGSGSVGAAIVASGTDSAVPNIIWSAREHFPERSKITFQHAEKDIEIAVRKVFQICGTAGIKALLTHDARARIARVQVSIAAPWAYTIMKTVGISHNEVFTVSDEILEGMIKKADAEVNAEFKNGENSIFKDLVLTSNTTMAIHINGYTAENAVGKSAQALKVTRLFGLTYASLAAVVEDAARRTFPNAELRVHPFMHLYYTIFKTMHRGASEVCLIHVTGEATEIGIIRENVLMHASYTPYGVRTIMREITDVCSVPMREAAAHIRENDLMATERQSLEVAAVLELYETNVAELFSRVGDTLSIPRRILVHADPQTETFFIDRIMRAAKQATIGDFIAHPLASQYFNGSPADDSALLLSAHAFHSGLEG